MPVTLVIPGLMEDHFQDMRSGKPLRWGDILRGILQEIIDNLLYPFSRESSYVASFLLTMCDLRNAEDSGGSVILRKPHFTLP